ncbi:MAG: HlyD family type I secretion periplasmic adaptor subunit [Magnetococcales bacterium]|nr:HlyD family type I secretion periplasmic adaptor subunit [Magnetococcales bacterium]
MKLFEKHPSPSRIRALEVTGNLKDAGVSFLIRRSFYITLIIMLPLIIWLSQAKIQEVAHVSGQVIPSGSVNVVQHLEGGIVSEVLVHESKLVQKGEVLFRFDANQALPEKAEAELRLKGLEARAIRLRAFEAGEKPDFSSIDARFGHLVATQQRIYQDQMYVLSSNQSMVNAQIAQRKSELKQVQDDLQIAHKQVELTADMVEIRKKLVEKKAISKVVYLETIRANVTAQGEVKRLYKQIENIKSSLTEAQNRAKKIVADAKREANSELGVVINESTQLRESMAQMEDRVTRLDVLSPVRGIAQELQVKTAGTVVPPGATLVNIVPLDDQLRVEVRISPEDIGRVTPGQPVVVKMSSYEFSHFGSMFGRLISVSPSTMLDEMTSKPYYKGIVELGQNHIGNEPGKYPILPGMLSQVDISLGENTVFATLFRPVTRTIHDAFKER